jgi:hypothetical protein
VAVGETAGRAAVRFSRDGLDWLQVDDAQMAPGALNGVALTPDGFVAVGRDVSREDYDAAVFVSADGLHWDRVAVNDLTIIGPDDSEFDDLIAFAGGLMAVGRRNPVDDRRGCEQLLEGAFVASTETGLSCGWGRTTLWVSQDGGRTWHGGEPVDPPGNQAVPPDRPRSYYQVAAGGPGLVNLSEDDDGPLVWISGNGLDWRAIGSEPRIPQGPGIADIEILGRRIIAVGEDWDPNDPDQVAGASVWIGEAAPF